MAAKPADDRQPPVEADQRPACVDVTPGSLRDDDPHPAGESLHEPRRDQQLDRGADRAERGSGYVRDDADHQDALAARTGLTEARRSAAPQRGRSGKP